MVPTAARELPGKQHQQREQEAKKRAAAPPQELRFTKTKMEGRNVNMWNDRVKKVQSHQTMQTEETVNHDTRHVEHTR